ncbi:hypothetical protein PR048_005662 [Dryococelus australis]|uniref:Uncharacterized protein n=1 Tax=Dryococelus australis TaxID=614101 RepID=A0ABQ9I9W1_9NEOP|nr:hypothetical protein PR048_005662 [Dryococelus australis]
MSIYSLGPVTLDRHHVAEEQDLDAMYASSLPLLASMEEFLPFCHYRAAPKPVINAMQRDSLPMQIEEQFLPQKKPSTSPQKIISSQMVPPQNNDQPCFRCHTDNRQSVLGYKRARRHQVRYPNCRKVPPGPLNIQTLTLAKPNYSSDTTTFISPRGVRRLLPDVKTFSLSFPNTAATGDTPGHSGFSQREIVLYDAAGRRFFSGISSFPPPLYSSAAPFSPYSILIGSQDTAVSHIGEPGLIPDEVAPGFSHVKIMQDDAAGRWVFLGVTHFAHRCILTPLQTRLTSLSSAHKISMLRAAQISPLNSHYTD